MKLTTRSMIVLTASLLYMPTSAPAEVFPEKSPAQKLRADVAKQVRDYTRCLANALINCERTGVSPAAECDLSSGTVLPPADPKGKFAGAIAKCDAKLDYDRKGPKGNTPVQNYELIGCPTGTGGGRLADMNEFETTAHAAKDVIDGLGSVLPAASGCTDTKSCVAAAKTILTFATAFGNCLTTCENDYKDKKGNGGPNDDPLRCSGGDPKALACVDKAVEKFLKKAALFPFAAAVASSVSTQIDQQSDALFNVPADCS
jgi:hypothetical protein